MSKGAGRVERAITTFFAQRFAEAQWFVSLETEEICRAVFNTDNVTKAQRVAVLRSMKRMLFADNPALPFAGMTLHGMPPGCEIRRSDNRRRWLLINDVSKSPKRKPNRKLAAALRLLASNHQGERDAAVLAAQRLLTAKGLDWDDVAAAVDRGL